MSKICCFTGHRPNKFSFKYNEMHPDCIKIKALLKEEIEKTIKDGYDYFISGMALGVDMWVAEAVIELQKTYPNIKFEVAVPCANQECTWPEISQNRYRHILMHADLLYYVSRKPYQPYLMLQRDKYMVDKSSRLIAVFDGSSGGTKHTFDYAIEKGIPIVRIDPNSFEVTRINFDKAEQLSLIDD